VLGEVLKRFKPPYSERLLVGIDGIDDAGVYKLTEETALVQTVDFFPPIIDDPYLFGQVAAANALSDVYAMGGKPLTALNILCFPIKMSLDVVGDILRGGADKVAEAGAVIAGGHSVKDNEIKYGLAVTGLIDPGQIITNSGARIGDRLLLTKRLGTGIVSTALKQGKADSREVAALTENMTALNKVAGEAMIQFGVRAATDITGFGLAGHAFEMATASDVSLEIIFDRVSLLPGLVKHAGAGILTPGGEANSQHLDGKIEIAGSFDRYVHDLVCDAQTSGGLLMAVPGERADDFLKYLHENNVDASAVGQVIPKGEFAIYIR
jgi:selenide,water dikinase